MAENKHKRLIVACDGTWMDSDNGFEKDSMLPWKKDGHLQVPSNVTRIVRALRSEAAGDIPQVAYYESGIGTENSVYDHVIGGATGLGMSETIRSGYNFLATNYEPGDEIFLIGFSRGAFTARSIAGLISSIGLLTRKGLVDFYPIFKDWENQLQDDYKTLWPDQPYANRPKITDPSYSAKLKELGLTRLNIPIKAVCVWDTVGSLGIPDTGLWPKPVSEYAFVDTAVSANVEYAFQALALDEHRKPFSPTIWEKPAGQVLPKVLKQCWFPGVHSNIGGSYPDTGIADITLAWMMCQLHPLLEFDPDYLNWQQQLHTAYYGKLKPPQDPRPWGMGKLYNSKTGFQRLSGTAIRTPSQYVAANPKTGAPTGRRLRETNEHVHISVRMRLALHGLGTEDAPKYEPEALKDWKLGRGQAAGRSGYSWTKKDEKGVLLEMPEDGLGDMEIELLEKSPDIYKQVMADR